jgi:hypothetical protein
MRPVEGGASIKKNRQFLAKLAQTSYCFSESPTSWLAAPGRVARPGLRVLRIGNDSGMAPQAIGIAENGLGNGKLPARDCWERKSISQFRMTDQC